VIEVQAKRWGRADLIGLGARRRGVGSYQLPTWTNVVISHGLLPNVAMRVKLPSVFRSSPRLADTSSTWGHTIYLFDKKEQLAIPIIKANLQVRLLPEPVAFPRQSISAMVYTPVRAFSHSTPTTGGAP
jgi:hypothetical protein